MMTAPAFQGADRRTRGTRPRLRAVLLEQIRATGFALRGAALVAAALLVLATLAGAFQIATGAGVATLYSWPTPLPGLLGALLPMALWGRDERFGDGFLWTLPVDRRRHAVTKVLAGWVWLMGGVALFSLWLLALILASGAPALPVETLHVLASGPATGPLDPAALHSARWAPGPLILAVPFTAATATYLLASALALGTRHPLRWVIGIALTNLFASMASQAASTHPRVGWLADAPAHALRSLVEGRYGLDTLLTARAAWLDNFATLTTGERIVVWSAVPELSHWVIATLLWTGAGLLALWAAASRHRERRRA